MIKLIESDYIKLLPTKQEIIQRINQLCRKYGKSDAGKSLYHNLCDIGYYMEDKRKSFIQFAIDVLNNCYTDGIPYYPNDITDYNLTPQHTTNCDIIDAIDRTEESMKLK